MPYLKLPDSVEIDESKCSSNHFACITGCSVITRWIFGMVCRKTRISIIYSIKDKSHTSLVPILKRHIPLGSIIYTDSHMSYVNSMSAVSKLSCYGWYHYWTNHSVRFVHEKFPFCHSMQMESVWNDIKHKC